MAKTKISEFSATPGNNTDIDGINIAEGCAPSGINDAIRELMSQLKDFQAGTAGDSFNGPVNGAVNATVGATTPNTGAFTTLSASGVFSLTGDQVQISEGGTGAATVSGARTNLGLAIGTDVQAYDAQLSTLAGASADRATFLASDQGFAFRNRIINGDMVIDQRNAGASVTPASGATTYTLDRWRVYASQASKLTVQQKAGAVTPPSGFTSYLGITSSSAYSVLSSDAFMVTQVVEGFNTADLGWGAAGAQSVTLSFLVRSSLTGTFGGAIRNYAATRSYPFTFTISSANTWEYKTVTIAGDTSGTWATDASGSIDIVFSVGAGTTASGTAGAWAGANYSSATGAVSVVGTNGATFYITGVQLEAGSVATPFERRPYGTELALCQRYYNNQFNLMGGYFSTTSAQAYANFNVTMRATPTISLITGTSLDLNVAGVGARQIVSPTFGHLGPQGAYYYGTVNLTSTIGTPVQTGANLVQANAEL